MQRERNWSTNEVEEQVNPLWFICRHFDPVYRCHLSVTCL